MAWPKVLFVTITVLVSCACVAECIDRAEIEDAANIQRLMDIKRRIDFIHPFLKNTYPVAVVRNDSFYVYDVAENDRRYRFVVSAPSPIPVHGTLRASFPLDFYNGKAACIITPDVFEENDSIVTLCHEFVHCGQWHDGEQKIRALLAVSRRSARSSDPMWEINYPFPYDNEMFVRTYSRFFTALRRRDHAEIVKCREFLKECLDPEDYEYMVFQEWKEGLARYVENRISSQLGLKEHTYGDEKPFNRISFYAGGAAYIEYLERQKPGIADNSIRLFYIMTDQP